MPQIKKKDGCFDILSRTYFYLKIFPFVYFSGRLPRSQRYVNILLFIHHLYTHNSSPKASSRLHQVGMNIIVVDSLTTFHPSYNNTNRCFTFSTNFHENSFSFLDIAATSSKSESRTNVLEGPLKVKHSCLQCLLTTKLVFH